MLSSICVFCGSSKGHAPRFGEAAAELGRLLARKNIRLVYGGGNVGTMGILAEAALSAGGRVVGIIPSRLNGLVEHLRLSELIVVKDMHERKALMQEKADAFITLPGGIGTMEEFFEVWAWRYIGYHAKPIGLMNTGGFYDELLSALARMQKEGFVSEAVMEDLCVAENPEAMLDALEARASAGVRFSLKLQERQS